MIWNSTGAMTIVDLTVIWLIGVSLVALHQNRLTLRRLGLISSVAGIYAALILIGLFYVADLLIVHIVPRMTSQAHATQMMTILHLNASWIVFLVAVSVIASGLTYLVRTVVPSVASMDAERDRVEEALREHRDALEVRVEERAQELQREIAEHKESVEALRESEVRYRSLVEDMPALICRYRADGTLTFVNEQYCRYFNKSREQLIGRDVLQFIPEEDRAGIREHSASLTLKYPVTTYEYSVIGADGTRRWQRWTDRAIFDLDGWPTEYQSIGEDITESKWRDQVLRESEERFRNLFEGSVQGIYVHANFEPLFVNQSFCEMLGYESPDDLLGSLKSMDEHLAPHERDRISDYKDARLRGEDVPVRYEYDALDKNGNIVSLQNAVRMVNWQGKRAIQCTVIDVTEARRLSEQLSHQASHDWLTGLFNRRAFEQRLEQLLERAKTEQTEHVMCYLDLDQFKVINDSCGHTAGDELLRQIAVVLQQQCRGGDTLARLGGDEFALLLEHCSVAKAQRVTSAVLGAVENFRFAWEGKTFNIGVSIGVVPINEASENMANVLSMADAACYAAKDAGRNRVHICRDDDVELAARRGEMHWVPVINGAFENDRFMLYFQSIVPVAKDRDQSEGFELLIRMKDENGRLVVPGAFLPAAERYNLSTKLDRWVVGTAFEWFSRHQQNLQHVLMCSINLSGSSLGDNEFMEFIVERFRTNDVPAGKICFEVTETAAIANLTQATRFIKTLKSLGCRFALDDFGSGLSSFAYLRNLPVDYLKIDGMFVKDIVDDPIHLAMVKSINEMGHVMGKKTIAEFVENDAVLEKLREIGVDYAQGYGVDQPHPLEEFASGAAADAGEAAVPRVA